MSIMRYGSLKICPACCSQNPTHMGCIDPRGQDEQCFCWAASWVHRSKFRIQEYGDFERDHEHDTGEDEFDTWIARNEREDE